MKITVGQYNMHRGEYDGYCARCDDVTNFGDVEPDATNYKCDECGNNTVYGMDLALILDLLDIELDEE